MKNVQKKVINEIGAIKHLQIFYPSLKQEIAKLSEQNNFAGIIQTTVNYMKSLLQESKINVVNHKIKMMDWLYRNGTQSVRQILENLFVRSFRSFKKQTDVHQWKALYQCMPLTFQKIYVRQTRMDEVLFKKH